MLNEQIAQETLQSDYSQPNLDNLITYELHRSSSNGGFGFDLKGDRPAIIGSVRKYSIAEQAGLKEGDLVITINNKKVTDLDHDQVVRLVGLSKNRLTLQVTKLDDRYSIDNQSNKLHNSKKAHNKAMKQSKKTNCKKLKYNIPASASSLHSRMPFLKPNVPALAMPPPLSYSQKQQHKSRNENILVDPLDIIAYSGDNNIEREDHILNINNTKTTEEEDDDESDYDYDLYLMTGRRRHRHHHHHKLNLTDNTNFTADSSQTGDSMPSINMPNERNKAVNYENSDQLINAYDEFDNEIEVENDEDNSDDFFDYDDDFTEDTVSTEDTEDNSSNMYNEYRRSSALKVHKQMIGNQMISNAHKNRASRNYYAHSNRENRHFNKKSSRTRYAMEQRYMNQARSHSANKRASKAIQQSPAKQKSKVVPRSSKSQNAIPPPILTSTFQQSQADNYVNMQLNEADLNAKNKHNFIENVSIESDEHAEMNQHYEDFNKNNQLQQQLRHQNKQLKKQELVYCKQLKYTNKLKSYENSSLNKAQGQQQSNYQNSNYNLDYQNIDALKNGQKNYLQFQQPPQHLKHIENVYKHSNMLQNYPTTTDLGFNGTNHNIDCSNNFNNSGQSENIIDSSLRVNSSSSTSNLYYLQKVNQNYFESIDENKSINDKFSINTTSDLSNNHSRDFSQNENIQPIKSFLIKQNMNMNMSKVANIKHFNLNNNNLQNIIKSSNNTNALNTGIQKSHAPHFDSANSKGNYNLTKHTSSCLNLGSNNTFNQLNVNDLYAILKPVIKPYIHDPNFVNDCVRPLEFSMLFMGNLKIPYDTLSNASKLNSVRKSVEYFLFQDKAENYQNVFVEEHVSPTSEPRNSSASTLVNLQVGSDYIKVTNKSSKNSQTLFFSENLVNHRSVVFQKNQIGFCGKIKENCQFFALVIVSEVNSQNNASLDDNLLNEEDSNFNRKLDNKSKKSTKSSSCCLIFRYIQNNSHNSSASVNFILNEISYLYRNQDCVFNMCAGQIGDQINVVSPKTVNVNSANGNVFQNKLNSPKIFYEYAPGNMASKSMNRNNQCENLEMIKTNMNYMNLSGGDNQRAYNIDKVEFNDGIILNKQTNDIYFKRMAVNDEKNSPDMNFIQSQVRSNRRKNKQEKNSLNINSSSCSSTNNLSNMSASMNRSNTSSNVNDSSSSKNSKIRQNKSKTSLNSGVKLKNDAEFQKSPIKTSYALNIDSKKPSSSSLGHNNNNNKSLKNTINNRISSSSHKNFKSSSLTTATFLKTLNTSEKKFQRNTEHTQSIKLIKENFANLFLSKKSNGLSNKVNSCESNGSSSSNLNTESSEKATSHTKLEMPDDELLKAIEFETNKNIQQKKKNRETEARGSSASLTNSECGTTKFSLSNRLSARFSSSKPKKSNSHQAFQFLRSKNPVSHNSAEFEKKEIDNDEFLYEEEDFFDADQVINSIDLPSTIDKGSKASNSSSMSKKNSVRLSLPSNGNGSIQYKPSTSKRLFNLISGAGSVKHQQQQQQQQVDKTQAFQNNQQRRLSDFHRPTKSLIVGDEENQNNGDKLSQTKISLTNSLTDVNEDLINEKNNEIGRVTKWAIGFEKLLEDPLGLEIFTNFLKKEFSNENIDFWVKCENFKKITDPTEMKKIAHEIWANYLDTSSMTQINVDSKARSHCKEALQNPDSEMFEKAQTHIFNLMRYDSYSRFLKSPMYKDCIVNEMSGKPLTQTDLNSNQKNLPNGSPKLTHNNKSSTIKNSDQPLVSSSNSIEKGNNENGSIPSACANLAAAVQIAASTGTAVLAQNSTGQSSPASAIPVSINGPVETSPNKKDKKKTMSTILPWTKAFIKWKRLSGKGKKHTELPQQQLPKSPKSPNSLAKNQVNHHKNSVTISPPTKNSNIFFNNSDSKNLALDSNNTETSTAYSNTSLTLVNHVDNKFCRVLYSNDGSSTMIQTIPGQTVYQILKKIFNKKQIPWYKCDLYYVDEKSIVDQYLDSQVIGSKEICLVERCLFILSLIPIEINLCVKASFKKTVISVLKPILESYQIKVSDYSIYLNSTAHLLNIGDMCTSVDNQNILVIQKAQSNSYEEIEKYAKLSIDDFLPTNLQDYQLQFDSFGILIQNISGTFKSPTPTPIISSNPKQNNKNISINSSEKQGNFIDMLNRVQKFSFEDQRGPIDTNNLKVPEFLLSNNLIKSQSLNQNINLNKISLNSSPNPDESINKINSSLQGTQSFNYTRSAQKNLKKNSLISTFNESTSSLPVIVNQGMNKNNLTNLDHNEPHKTYISRSRSPMIVYDNDEENLEQFQINRHHLDGSCIDESCVIDNSISGFDKSLQSLNNQNLSSSFLYETDHNVIIEEGEINVNSCSDSLRMNNSILSMNQSPARSNNIQSDSLQKSDSKINSRISYV